MTMTDIPLWNAFIAFTTALILFQLMLEFLIGPFRPKLLIFMAKTSWQEAHLVASHLDFAPDTASTHTTLLSPTRKRIWKDVPL